MKKQMSKTQINIIICILGTLIGYFGAELFKYIFFN